MGTWGIGFLENDVAVDAKLEYEEAMAGGATVAAAVRAVRETMRGEMEEDEDDHRDIVLALAWLTSRRGTMPADLRREAVALLREGGGVRRWAEAGPELQAARAGEEHRLLDILEGRAPHPEKGVRKPRPPRINYKEGDWFAVPLRDGGYAVGLVARMNGKGIVLGYFFGPRRSEPPSLGELANLAPEEAIDVSMFGDLGLIRKEWPPIGAGPGWDRDRWPIPGFGRGLGELYLRIEYGEDLSSERQTRISLEELRRLPEDGLSGAGAVEIHLTRLLSKRASGEAPA
jgi:hypothetical protein